MVKVTDVVGHQVRRTFGVVSTLAIISVVVFIGWSIYAGIIRPVLSPATTTDQHAEQIINPSYKTDVHFGGCANLRAIDYRKDNK